MGWKGTVRSIQAAGNRAKREQDKAERARYRAFTKVDRNVDQVMKKARSLETKLEQDPIKALSLTYVEGEGFNSEPFAIQTELFSGTVSLTKDAGVTDEEVSFQPPRFDTITSFVQPLNILITSWGTIVAFKVGNDDSDFQMRVGWVKKSDPRSSKILLLDEEESQYYYPFASSVSGQVIPGHPRIGLIVFEPFRRPTSTIQLHFSDIQLQGGRGGKHSFAFSYVDQSLKDHIQEMLQLPDLTQRITETLDQDAQRLRSIVNKSQSGCLVMLFLLVGTPMLVISVLSILQYL